MFNPILRYYGKLNNHLFIEGVVNKKSQKFESISVAGNIAHNEPTKSEYVISKHMPTNEGEHFVIVISDYLEIRHHSYKDFNDNILSKSLDYFFIIEVSK